MKVTNFLNYFLFQVIYQFWDESTRAWYAFNLITHIGLIAYMCFLLGANIKSSDIEKQILGYVQVISISHCIYLVYCVFINDYHRIVNNTDVFSLVYAMGLIVFLFTMPKNK